MKKQKALLLPMLFLIFSCDTPEEPDCAGIPGGNSVRDIDENCYATIQIGEQLWMAENLKVTHYKDGSAISTGHSGYEWMNLSTGAYGYYDDDSTHQETYGNLYNWYTVDDDRGLCMDGWHVPTDEEFMELEMFLGMSEEEADSTGFRGTDEGSKLAGNSDLWFSIFGILDYEEETLIESDPEFGTSGFNGLPAGVRGGRIGTYYSMGSGGYFWSSSEDSSYYPWTRGLYYSDSSVNRHPHHKWNGFSIRCLGN